MRGEYFIQKCGGLFDPMIEQEFQSPSYPNAYPSSTFCHWIFKRMNIDFEANSIPGYKLTFIELDIGHNCDQDYFLVSNDFIIFILIYFLNCCFFKKKNSYK